MEVKTQNQNLSTIRYYSDLIKEYEFSRSMIHARIDELSKIINSADGNTPENNKRRYNLYMDVWHIDSSIKEMREYISCLKTASGLPGQTA